MPLKPKPITIAGGGLAGLTLGILLRRADVPTTIYEAGNYPRHKVCGEFISGRGTQILQRLQVLNENQAPLLVEQADFYARNRKIAAWKLPEPAFGISRFSLDQLLADTFRKEGGKLVTHHRFTDKDVKIREGTVFATGRKVTLDSKDWRYIGLKAHANLRNPVAHLQIHFMEDGYVGLSPLPNGLTNVCGLFRFKSQVQNLKSEWKDLLRGAKGSALRAVLDEAEFHPESFSAVAGLNFRKEFEYPETLNLGDRLGMIAPLTGNGMSMALETAELSSRKLIEFAVGRINWEQTITQVHGSCERLLARRLVIARLFQKVLLTRSGQNLVFPIFGKFPLLIDTAYRWTHT